MSPVSVLFVSIMFSRRLQDMSSKRLQDMSSRRVEDVFKTNKCLPGYLLLLDRKFVSPCWNEEVGKKNVSFLGETVFAAWNF